MLFLCLIIFSLAVQEYLVSNKQVESIDFSSFKDQISKLKDQKKPVNKGPFNKFKDVNTRSFKTTTSQKENLKLNIELNTADTLALKQIYGIGSVLSKRIIKYRDLLGGFYDKNQLLSVYGMDTNTYHNFKHQIFVDLSLVKKIDVNFATANDLSKHPFVHYKLANSIVNYRDIHGLFSSKEELMNLYLIDTVLFNKLLPYLEIND